MYTVATPQVVKANLSQTIDLKKFFQGKPKPSGVWLTIIPFYQNDIDFKELSQKEVTPAMQKSIKAAKKISKNLLCDL